MKTNAVKGKYKPKNRNKTPHTSVVYRSLWERRFMRYCDLSPNILYWENEPFSIPYQHDKQRNYYPDFLVTLADNTKLLIEIKPEYQTRWKKNKDKWKAAREYCKENDLIFKVLTENELF
jgi:hypothetical protein